METTRFSKLVRMRLIYLDKDYKWLCEEVSKKTGKYFDSSYYSKILRGKVRAPKMRAAIREILDLPEEGDDA